MAYRLKRTHPFAEDRDPVRAARDDLDLLESARFAADAGLLSRRALLTAGTGVAAWLLVLETPAFAKKVGGRKGYAIQGIVDRDQLLSGVVEPENPMARDTLSAAWGKLRSLRDSREGIPSPLGDTAVEFARERDGYPETRIDPQGLRPNLTSPFDREERYGLARAAEDDFAEHERSSLARVREVLVEDRLDQLGRHPRPDMGVRFLVTTKPTPVWCNLVKEVQGGAKVVLPAGSTLTYHGRRSNSVLVNHPAASAAAHNGRLATFVDARNLVDFATKKRLYVFDRELPDDHEPSKGCLRRDHAERLCSEQT